MSSENAVAIVGMAVRVPGASTLDEFWRNLVDGRESITRFDPAQLSPLVPPALRAHARFVPARGVIADADRFDATFFGIAPAEALLMDPQQRVFLELSWNALEHAGVGAPREDIGIGVYAGVSNNGYRKLVEARPDLIAASGEFAAMLANEKDYVATRVAHRLGLHGPAISLYTACSTSLVAVAQAWYALMSWQCDVALAGGINIVVPQESGYVPVDGGMESDDGHCRPFDAAASGTVFSSGGGVVVLKRLADALADRDHIWAVLRGVGVNNDGGDKASFTAPSARGQAEAIRLALASADASADSIGYVEAHGTGTALGDPIEVEALTRAYRVDTAARQYCWLGSVKSNIGHLVAGSGVAGLIKCALALHHERIPPTLHYNKANAEIDFARTPFKIAASAQAWPRAQQPRRAGVSSFGVGGTNAHVILEEAPALPVRAMPALSPVVLPLSARDEQGLRDRAADLAAALGQHSDSELADIGWSLATGRRPLRVRGAVVAATIAEAQTRLRELATHGVTNNAPAASEAGETECTRSAAQQWCRGDPVDWEHVYTGAEYRRVPLPGYPFRGQRYWIDAVPEQPAAPEPAEVQTAAPDVHARLRDMIGALAGAPVAVEQHATSLLDLGLDSLALTQLALELEQHFGVKPSLRQLMGEAGSIEKIAALVARGPVRPPAASEAPPAPAQSPGAPLPAFGAAARITLTADTALEPRQRRWLDAFIDAYTARTQKSKAFAQQHRAPMADPRVVTGFHPLWKELVYPLVVARSDGARLWDVDGNEYIDLLNGFGANFLGYQPEFIKRALREQIDAGFEIGPQHPLAADVAALIRDLTGVERVAFCNTGSEAVMGAMRIARTVSGRKTIVIFKDSYHGIFDEVIVRGTRELRSLAAAPGILANAVENVLVLDYGSAAALDVIRARAGDLAAVMIEPVQSRNPALQPREFVHELRRICDAHGCALIFDEVITGFRVSPGGAQEFYGMRADIVTYGKIIGGGLPFAAIAGSSHWLDALDGGDWRFGDASRPEAGVTYFAGTFVRHPLALAAANAALTHLKQSGPALQRELNARTRALATRLNAFFERTGAPLHVEWFSSLWRLRADAEQPLAELLHYALRARGLHVYAQFGCFLSTAHGDAEVEQIATRIEAATLELLEAGLLRRRALAEPADEDAPAPLEIPLTPAQAEKWSACQFDPQANVAFNESMLLHLRGDLDERALRESIVRVCARHEAFAMSFVRDGTALRIDPAASITPNYIDLAVTGETVEVHCAPLLRAPFDLTHAPLARIELMRIDARHHALLIVAHHLVFDGWSARIFLDEVALGYRALACACEPAWPPAERFRDFAQTLQQRASAAQAQLEYWKAIYATLPDALALPTDRPRSGQPSYAADTVFHDFAADLTRTLRDFARAHGLTAYSVLLAGLGVLLARLSGQDDFAIGIPFAAQAATGTRNLIGDGVNTLPLRMRVDVNGSFLELCRRCHQLLLDAADNQDITVHTLQNALGRQAHNGVFTSLVFNLNPRLPTLDFGALDCNVRDCAKTAQIRDLFFNFNDSDEQLTLDLHYRTALFDAATIRRWIDHYQTLLRASVAEPHTTVGVLPLFDEVQRAQLVRECGAEADYNLDAALSDLIREQALRTPQRTAIECDGDVVSYADLAARAHAFARTLRAHGVGLGDVVGICMPRGIDMVAGLLGILASGAAYLPLDPAYPAERLRLLADDAGVQHVLAATRTQESSALAHMRKVHALDEFAPAPAVELPHVSGAAPAYVLYTSGSTGTPKGVRVLHRNLVNCLLAMRERPGLGADDTLCAITPLTFDIAALELFLPLLVGARVLLATETERRDPDVLLALMRRRSATVLQTTPSWLRALTSGERLQRLPRVKLLVGGEELPRDLATRVLPHCRELWNMYGPTETTIWSACCRVASAAGPVPIGHPVANTYIYVVDAHGQLTPPGVRGEIWIGGAGVAAGYLDVAATARHFTADPFRDDAQVYRTGDIGSWRDGLLYFHGRRDTQFKLRGFRIEPAEIEAAALAVPGVRAAVATVFTRSDEDRRLALYVVAPAATPEFASTLRDRLRRTLPPQMVPQHIELLDALPQTAHGKIDRKALPAPRPLPGRVETPATELPTDPVTSALLRIWKDLLGTDAVSLDANFFDLGGDSLLGVQLFQRAQDATGVNLPLSTLLTAQTVREQARAFRSADAQRAAQPRLLAWSPLVSIQESGSRPPLFCVHALGGNVLNYVPLARALGPDQPVFGLQAIGIDGVSPPLRTIEEMAARYLPEIRARCPHGPYYLCGGSMGGLIAYELAQRLSAAGERIAFVGLFDTYGPGCTLPNAPPASAVRRWRERFTRFRMLDVEGRRAQLARMSLQRLNRGRDALLLAWCRWRGTALPHAVRYRELERIHWQADFAYRPSAYVGDVHLFRARQQPEPFAGMHALGWETVALGGVHVIDLPGTHETLIEQPELATALRAVLAHAQAPATADALPPTFRLAG